MSRYKRNQRPRRNRTRTIKNLKKIIIVLLFIIALSFLALGIRNYQFKIAKISKEQTQEKQINDIFANENYSKVTEEKNIEKPDDVINIMALGNVLYNHTLYESIFENNTGIYLFSDFLSQIKKYSGASDFTIANLGVDFIGDYMVEDGKTNAPDDLAIALKNFGINLVNTASKNSNNNGQAGIQKTLEKLDSLKIEHTGTARAKIENLTPVIKNIRGINVCFLSYTNELNKPLDSDNAFLVNIIKKDKIIEDIKNAKEKGAECVVISLISNKNQDELANELIKNGANIVLENDNTGVVKNVSKIENVDGNNAIIASNTGNFIALNEDKNTRFEVLLNIEITKNAKTGNINITNVKYKPVYLQDKGENVAQRYALIDAEQEKSRYEHNLSKVLTQEDYINISEGLDELQKRINIEKFK